MAVQSGKDELDPEIVVVERINTGDTELRITAAVANEEQVTEAEAKLRWARFAAIPDTAFYLFVPVGYGAQAKKMPTASDPRRRLPHLAHHSPWLRDQRHLRRPRRLQRPHARLRPPLHGHAIVLYLSDSHGVRTNATHNWRNSRRASAGLLNTSVLSAN